MLYNVTIAAGLFLGALSFMVEPVNPRRIGFSLAAVSFLIAALNAGGVIH